MLSQVVFHDQMKKLNTEMMSELGALETIEFFSAHFFLERKYRKVFDAF